MIDLKVFGDPAACTAAATSARRAKTALDDAVSALSTVRSRSESAWDGLAAEAFRVRVAEARNDVSDLQEKAGKVAAALDHFAGELASVRAAMDQAREIAASAGCPVTQDGIWPAPAPADEGTTGGDGDADAAYQRASTVVGEARTKEDKAHNALGDALTVADDDGWLIDLLEKLGFAPPDHVDVPGAALFGLGLTGFAAGTGVDWMVKARYGRFQPLNGHLWGTTKGLSFWERARAATRENSWHAKPYRAAVRGKWETAGKVVKVGGAAVTFATSAWDQWSEDADDPTLATDEKVGRAAAKATATTAGAWAGAEAGAWVGGAIGTAICPGAGTVIGGAVGGVIGGFAGSEVGGWVGDQAVEIGGKAGDALGDVVGGAGDVASDVGDALSFWD